ncbi:DEAD/DEAH box type DNA/RNA helicase protein [Rhizobium gallicum]|uniref:DEAD/DEAH box type DNA/RNA helicase protein n=1 Tax=Rhizobium gallicum TaxID=56730 RepID=A0A1L5NHX0_9HYPH|nr:DEAD/DEAH box helicase family protein [Rhizobium gallicum]APO67513.1 DEAD/DEAH box type DNA/RNA helicase protein [Rhizobium gallicum]
MIDFNKLSRPKTNSAPLDPLEIFAKTPNLSDAPNDLWKGQAEALGRWHQNRDRDDNAILLNTGAGKSIVGVLIAQSLVNEQIGPIVFACSTIDLVEQTARECQRLGISYTTRTSGEFSDDKFETGRAFCITTYQALFTANSTFSKGKAPAGVIFDDAHVAERMIRDAFTLSISKEAYPLLYSEVVALVRPEFEKLNKGPHLNSVLEQHGLHAVTMCPPGTAFRCRDQIIEAIKRVKDWNKPTGDLLYPTLRLWENIGNCAIYISATGIEITPPFIPTGVYSFLGKGVRRVYLSATLEFETDFVRGFGRRIANHIAPDNDAGNGERLILLSSLFKAKPDKKDIAYEILKANKLLISVPSYPKAQVWKQVGTPPTRANFSVELQAFRKGTSGAFILVSRIDGIDLPQNTCRVMLIDGAPSGTSLMDQYLFQHLSLSNLFSTKMAGRITQLLGRINRGRSDYGAFLIHGADLNVWLKTERNVALLPPLIRKQVILGQTVQDGLEKSEAADIAALIAQVISRDQGWLQFYRETVDGLEVSQEALTKVKERESQLAASAMAECEFMTRMWQGDIDGARDALLSVLDATALADAKLAGWYSVWLGAAYENEGDHETSIAHYKKARSRLSAWINVPFKGGADAQIEAEGATSPLQKSLLSINHHGPQAIGDLVWKLKQQAKILLDGTASANAKEEAVRMFGELLGLNASRPDNDYGQGPDVIWTDTEGKTGVAFELKTQKNSPAEYTKQEVGQAHNHLQWLADNEGETGWQGLLIVGPPGICKSEASPSDNIFLVETQALAARMLEFAAKVEDTKARIAIERWTLLKEIGGLSEWQAAGWFGSLAKMPLKNLKA